MESEAGPGERAPLAPTDDPLARRGRTPSVIPVIRLPTSGRGTRGCCWWLAAVEHSPRGRYATCLRRGDCGARAALRRLRDRELLQQRGTGAGAGACYVPAVDLERAEGPRGV